MTFLPIVERELRVAARKRSTFWLRVVAALIALTIGGGFLMLSLFPFGGRTQMGGPLFATLTWLSVAAALSAGLFFTSDCLSEEKREGTIGFLFLTDLRGYDVVLGKLLATSLRGCFALLAMFPVLAVTQLMGGVGVAEFWKTLLALVNAMFFSLAAGMFVSSMSHDSQRAMIGTLELLLLFLIGGPALDGLLAKVGYHGFIPVYSLSSPGYAFAMADNWGPTFWKSLLTSHVVAWALLGLACVLIPRTWQRRGGKQSATRQGWSYFWRYGGARRRAALRRKLLSQNPVLWLACRERWQSLTVWVLAILVLGTFAVLALSDLPTGAWMVWGYVGSALTLAFYLGTASQASRFLLEARRGGLIELLLAAPLNGKDIAQGQWRALLRMFAVPVALFLCVHLAATLLAQRATWGMMFTAGVSLPDTALTIVTAASSVLVVAANLVALCWFAMWMGLTSKNANLATLKTLAFVQVIPWFVITFASSIVTGLLLMQVMIPAVSKGTTPNPANIMVWYPLISAVTACVLSVGKDVFFIIWARRKLYLHFRDLAVNAVSPIRVSPLPAPMPRATIAPPVMTSQL